MRLQRKERRSPMFLLGSEWILRSDVLLRGAKAGVLWHRLWPLSCDQLRSYLPRSRGDCAERVHGCDCRYRDTYRRADHSRVRLSRLQFAPVHGSDSSRGWSCRHGGGQITNHWQRSQRRHRGNAGGSGHSNAMHMSIRSGQVLVEYIPRSFRVHSHQYPDHSKII
ncbi:hypothetical protein PENTCL1PPCAC_20403 [Pristionchus entomophagus]|uniref:Ribosomal protein n=1 Tax=Pristionchus entomophagus TaxID=358040 RepID=A0AAV5TVH8_9BILA|nr:hypothetical protein PENTCL1PPCAC_20403 [Pristionchus entomophagus]